MLSYDEDGLILNVLLLELRMVRTEVAGCVTRVLPSRKEAQCLMTETEAKQKKNDSLYHHNPQKLTIKQKQIKSETLSNVGSLPR